MLIYGPWVRTWKRRLAAFVATYNAAHQDDPIKVPPEFNPNTLYWGPHAQELARLVKKRAGVDEPDGRLDGALRKILRKVALDVAPPFLGIDVSNHNGTIDWRDVAADSKRIRFAYAKATERTGFVDAYYARNKAGAKKNGIAFGAYAYVHPGSADYGIAQMKHFLAVANYEPTDLAPAIDWEESAGAVPAQLATLEACVEYVRKETGVFPVIYGGAYILRGLNAPRSSVLRRCVLWLPWYGRNDGGRYPDAQPPLPSPWPNWDVHQFTSSGSVEGIVGRVDLNYSRVPLSKLRGAK